jgi:inner membrane protein
MLLIAIPLTMIQSTISDRMRFRDDAVRSIAADSVSEQTLLGPVLVIPYTESFEDTRTDAQNKTVLAVQTLQRRLLVFPNDLTINSNVDTDQRYRGIHKVLVYSGQHALSGDFTIPAADSIAHEKPGSRIIVGNPFISVGLRDTRGLKNFPKLSLAGKSYEFKQGSRLKTLPSGLHASLPQLDLATAGNVRFSLDLMIDGIEKMEFIPLAKNNQISLHSRWPHPQFGGRFLPSPKDRKITNNGFKATWNISSIASQAQQQISNREVTDKNLNAAEIDSFEVNFIEPVNIYSQADRAVKYGMLFIALTFAAFFLFELLKQLPIHPVQYVLVGLALALFFLLLVSLSEHMRFIVAYGIASAACILLIAFYLANALRSWLRGAGFGIALTTLYGVLYGLLQSENNALVLGSLLLFSVLAAIMVVTRKVDWYAVTKVNISE